MDKDNLVRRVKVQPHKLLGQTNMPQSKERTIHDLALLKAINTKDNTVPDCTTSSNITPEAKIPLSSSASYDREMFCSDPSERPKALYSKTSIPCSLQTPEQLIDQTQMTEEEISAIQNTASVFLNKIHKLQAKHSKLNSDATSFNPSLFRANKKSHTKKKLRWKVQLT